MNSNVFDSSYFDRLRTGDETTEGHFTHYFSELLLLKLRSRLQDHQASDDIRKETLVRVLSLLRSSPEGQTFNRLGSMVNSACDEVIAERLRFDGRSSSIEKETAGAFFRERPQVDCIAIPTAVRECVHSVLNELGERDRNLLRALYEQADPQKVCRSNGISRDDLLMLVHRSTRSFGRVLAKAY